MILSCRYQLRLPQRPPAVWNRRNTCRPSSAPSPSTSNPMAATPSPTAPSSACPQVLQRYQVHPSLNVWVFTFLFRLVFAPFCVLQGSYLLLVSSWLHKKCYLYFGLISKGTGAQLCGYIRRAGHDEVTSHPSLSLHSLLSAAVLQMAQTTQILPRQLCSVATIMFHLSPPAGYKAASSHQQMANLSSDDSAPWQL